MKRMKPVLILGLLLGLFSGVSLGAADPPKDSAKWDNLKILAPGDNIRVVLNDAKSYRGKFQSATDTALVVLRLKGEQTFGRANIKSVSTKMKSHRGRNALLGAAMGGAVMLGVSAAQSGRVYTLVFGIPAGVAAGAIVGWMVPTGRWHVVYRAQ